MPIQRLAQAKEKNAALSQEQRASWNCDVWCVTTRNYYSWAGWTGFVVDSFLRVRKHEKERDFMVHHLEDMFSKKTFYWLLQSKEKPCIYTIYIYMCVCVCVLPLHRRPSWALNFIHCMCACMHIVAWLIWIWPYDIELQWFTPTENRSHFCILRWFPLCMAFDTVWMMLRLGMA